MDNNQLRQKDDIKPLTSFRFIAAAGVVFAHYGYNYNTGGLGVEFFFVLSGFILAINYKLKFERLDFSNLRAYYISRVARIYPVHIFTFMLSIPLVIFSSESYTIIETALNILLLQAWVPSGISVFSYNGVSWTLSCEIFFYLLFPVLCFLFSRFVDSSFTSNIALLMSAYLISIAMALAVGSSISQFSIQWWMALISPISRAFDFIVGTAAGFLYIRVRDYLNITKAKGTLIEIASFMALFIFYLWHHNYATAYIWNNSIYFNLFIAALIFSFSFQSGVLSEILSVKWLTYLGEVSFSMYMVHQLMIRYCERYVGSIVYHANDIKGASIQIGFFILIVMASILTYEIVEKPFRRKIRSYT